MFCIDMIWHLWIGYAIGIIHIYLIDNKILYLTYSDFFRNNFSSSLMCSGISANLCSVQIIPKNQWMNHGEHREEDFGFLTVTGLTRCSSHAYRKKIHFLLCVCRRSSLKGIITTLHPLSKFRTDEFVSVRSLLAEWIAKLYLVPKEHRFESMGFPE